MLVLTSRIGERIFLDGGVSVMLVDIVGDKVRLGFEAPPNVRIIREALPNRIESGETVARPRFTSEDVAAMTARGERIGQAARGCGRRS